jgi:hypothetical protein
MTHYEVLGVGPSADDATLHEAYVALARRHHPDRAGGDATRMQVINEAWATLGDPVRRARYDRSLAGGTTTTSRPAAQVADVVDDDLDDDTPVRITVALPRWLSLLPVATFGTSVVVGFAAVMTASGQLLGLAVMTFVLSCMFFLAAPFVALFSARRTSSDDGGR